MATEKPFKDKAYTPPERHNNNSDRNMTNVFQHERIGSGNMARYSDSRGTWWGAENPEEAGVWIHTDGIIDIRATSLTSLTGMRYFDDEGNLSIFLGIGDL